MGEAAPSSRGGTTATRAGTERWPGASGGPPRTSAPGRSGGRDVAGEAARDAPSGTEAIRRLGAVRLRDPVPDRRDRTRRQPANALSISNLLSRTSWSPRARTAESCRRHRHSPTRTGTCAAEMRQRTSSTADASTTITARGAPRRAASGWCGGSPTSRAGRLGAALRRCSTASSPARARRARRRTATCRPPRPVPAARPRCREEPAGARPPATGYRAAPPRADSDRGSRPPRRRVLPGRRDGGGPVPGCP